jgi:phasin family protein
MFESPFFSTAAFDAVLKSLTPVARFTELSAQSFEKLAKLQVEAAIDLVNHGATRLQTAAQTTSPASFVARHSELTTEFLTKQNQKWHEFVKYTNDLQADVTKWADDTKSHIAASFPKVA